MEKPLFLGRSALWLGSGSDTWITDVTFALLCGLGLFLLLLPWLPGDQLSPPPGKRSTRKMAKTVSSKVRKKSDTLKARRDCLQGVKDIQDLLSLLHSHLALLRDRSGFRQLLGGHGPDETLSAAPAAARRPPSQPEEDASQALPLASTSQASVRSASSVGQYQPPEPPISLEENPLQHSPGASSLALPPSLPDPRLDLLACEPAAVPESESFSSSSSPRPPPPGLGPVACPASASSWWQVAARAWLLSPHGQGRGDGLSQRAPEVSWAGAPFTQVEAGGFSFINPDAQELLELMISKRVEMKACQEGDGRGLEPPLENFPRPRGPWQDTMAPTPSWDGKAPGQWPPFPKQLLYHQVLRGHSEQKGDQLCWGLPVLHSESLVLTVRLPDSLPDFPSIFFNGLPNFLPAHVRAKAPHKPLPREYLPHVLVQPQPKPETAALTPSSSASDQDSHPPLAQIVARVQPKSPLPILACPAPPRGKRPAPQGGAHLPLPPAAQHLEYHLLRKRRESQRALPSLVKKSQELFSRPTSSTRVPRDPGSAVNLPRDFISPGLREQLEQHLRERFAQQHCGVPSKVQLCLDLMESGEKLPATEEAEGSGVPSWTSLYSSDSSQEILEVRSGAPETFEVWKYASNNPGYSLKRLLTDVARDSGSFQAKAMEALAKVNTGLKTDLALVTPSSSDSESDFPTGTDRKAPAGAGKAYSRGKSPEGSRLATQRCWTPPGNSDTQMETGQVPFLKTWDPCKPTSQDLFILDARTQKALEAHIKRFWTRHRWGLALKVVRPLSLWKLKRARPVPLAQPDLVSRASRDSKSQPFTLCATALGQAAPAEAVVPEMSAPSLGCLLSDPSFKSPRMPAPGDRCRPSEAPPAARGGSPSPPGLVGRAWHRDAARVSGTGSLELSAGPGAGWSEVQEGWGAASDGSRCSVSVPGASVGSQYSKAEEIRELDDDEEEGKEAPDWVDITRKRLTADFKTIYVTPRSPESLDTSQGPCLSRIAVSQDLGVPGPKAQSGPEKKLQNSAKDVVILQDCASGMLLQDCAPEVRLAADILASQASLSSSQSMSGSGTPTLQGLYRLLSRVGSSQQQQEPKVPQPQDPWENWSVLGLIMGGREDCGRPGSGGPGRRLAEERPAPAQVRGDAHAIGSKSSLGPPEEGEVPSETQLRNRIKNFLQYILPSKRREWADLVQKPTPSAAAPRSSGLAAGQQCVDSNAAQTQGLMAMLEWTLGLHREPSASKENLHEQKPQAPGGTNPLCHEGPAYPGQRCLLQEVACVQHASPQGHSHHRRARDKEDGLVLPPRERRAVSPSQQRPRGKDVSSHHIHCPRHCLIQRNLLSGQPAFYICSNRKTFPQENIQAVKRKSASSHVSPPSAFEGLPTR